MNEHKREEHIVRNLRSSCFGAMEMNRTRNREVTDSIPGLAQWVKDPALLCTVVLACFKALWNCFTKIISLISMPLFVLV